MCKNLAEKVGPEVTITVYDIVPDRAHAIASKVSKANIAVSSNVTAAAATSDTIFYMVPNDDSVMAVLKKISETSLQSKLIVDCSTVHPDTSRKEESYVKGRGGQFISCPVFGSAAMAQAGELIAVPAGERQSLEKILPFCTGVMSRDTIALPGQEPAKATLLKLVGNTFILNMVGALSEGHTLAEKSGLGSENLHKFISSLFPGPYTAYSERMVSGDYWSRTEPLGMVELALKDARHAKKIAAEADMRMKLVEVVEGYLEVVLSLRGAHSEFVAAYGAKRVESGLDFENTGMRVRQ
jgi:3-hydroxyisobutyrate dehydrogenase-like beta-hydroxyacid dehydrogenase